MKIEEKFDKKLLVEGNNDQHVILALCNRFEIAENFDIIDSKSIGNLFLQIPVRFKQSEVNTIGIIIDADTDIKSRWLSLSALLKSERFTVPDNIPTDGLVISANDKKVGVWIMPNNSSNGMLEDFISFLVPKDDQLLTVANDTLNSIEEKGLNKYAMVHKSKALIHTWLSWQDDPGTPMGLAITKRYLTTDENICLQLMNWLKSTFND